MPKDKSMSPMVWPAGAFNTELGKVNKAMFAIAFRERQNRIPIFVNLPLDKPGRLRP
jgi:hypothetical protein